MNEKKLKKRAFLALIMCLILLAALSVATFAWFTNNSQVGTNRVSGRTATEDVRLEISSLGGSDFSPEEEAGITQINETKLTYLMPVSTEDLVNFVACPNTVEGFATNFTKVEKEENYYHGRVYIRARVIGGAPDARVNIYLDESQDAGGALVQKSEGDSLILNAARLGLMFNDQQDTAVIFRLSEENNSGEGYALNTKLNGEVLGENTVLAWNGNSAVAAADPSVLISDYLISEDSGIMPAKPLFSLERDVIYPVDIYFYLEGCDPDCTEAISFNGNDLHLAFYGVLS